jgi:hypothetical protein
MYIPKPSRPIPLGTPHNICERASMGLPALLSVFRYPLRYLLRIPSLHAQLEKGTVVDMVVGFWQPLPSPARVLVPICGEAALSLDCEKAVMAGWHKWDGMGTGSHSSSHSRPFRALDRPPSPLSAANSFMRGPFVHTGPLICLARRGWRVMWPLAGSC